MKKPFTLFALALLLVAVPASAEARGVLDGPPLDPSQSRFQFQPIVSVPLATGGVVDASTSLKDYLNSVFTLSITIAAILGVVMITYDGLRYMTSDAIGTKKAALDGLRGAFFGLFLLLLSYTVLYVINPEILNLSALSEDLTDIGSRSNNATDSIAGLPAGAFWREVTPGTAARTGCTLKCVRNDNNTLYEPSAAGSCNLNQGNEDGTRGGSRVIDATVEVCSAGEPASAPTSPGGGAPAECGRFNVARATIPPMGEACISQGEGYVSAPNACCTGIREGGHCCAPLK